ncbi:MAG: alkaline phosphatase family protein [Thermoanaerobaculia bacterium]
MLLSSYLSLLAGEVGPEHLNGAVVLLTLDRPLDRLIQLAMGFGPYHPGAESPWSHSILLAADYAGPSTPVLDCTIRDKDGKVPWGGSLTDLLPGGIAGSGGIYRGTVSDYDDARVTNFGVKSIFDLSADERAAIVVEGEKLQTAGYHYDVPGLVRELVRLLTGVPIPAGKKLLFCSAFCQAAYRNALARRGDFSPTIRTEDITPDDIWYSSLGAGYLPPTATVEAAPVLSVAATPAPTAAGPPLGPPPSFSQIEHVVVLMLENRSFDHALGSLGLENPPRVDGLRPEMFNPSGSGRAVRVYPSTLPTTSPDPNHDLASVLAQLTGPNKGFVTNYEALFADTEKDRAAQIMGYYDARTMPVLHALANEYGLSDAWFCPVPAETWPNRLFAHAATSAGHVRNGLPGFLRFFDMPTIYDRLGDAVRDWACYNDQIPQMVCIRNLKNEWLRSRHEAGSHFRSIRQFYGDCDAATLPKYSFIEPVYFGGSANDDHPPQDIWQGQQLMADVYHALRASTLWPKTLFFILYDEHGGFFDHATPPRVPGPGTNPPSQNQDGFDFTMLGPRVPCVVVSPWIRKGTVLRPPAGGFFDHTSVLKAVENRWGLAPLTDRDRGAADLWPWLAEPSARSDDTATFRLLTDWTPPAETAPRSLVLAARASLIAPIGILEGKSGFQVAQTLAGLTDVRVGLLAAEADLAAMRPDLSEYQRSLTELAGAIVEAGGGDGSLDR